MGVTITAKNSKHSFDIGYFGFCRLRESIAMALDEEFGECYAELSSALTAEALELWEERINKILAHDRFKEVTDDVFDFFFAGDTKGEVDYKTCKKLYDIIKDVDFTGQGFVYTAHSDGKDYEYFKEFLLECYKHRRKMRWN